MGEMYAPEASIKGGNPSQYIASQETKMSQYSFNIAVAYVF